MISKRLTRTIFGCTTVSIWMAPALAVAATAAADAPAWQASVGRAAAAAVTMAVSAISAAYAQAKIGSAAAGTLAERPEAATYLIVLEALPEIIVLMGFVIAFMINNG